MIRKYEQNTEGRDFVVGDVHGCFSQLLEKLRLIRFDHTRDRLFSVGDLIDRGPESLKMVLMLKEPWFHAIRGNHEQMAMENECGEIDDYMLKVNGGQWFVDLTDDVKHAVAVMFSLLPFAAEIKTPHGRCGLIHAMVPCSKWSDLPLALKNDHKLSTAIWGRSAHGRVEGIELVVVGHTPQKEPTITDNVLNIDTGAGKGGKVTIVQINHPTSLYVEV